MCMRMQREQGRMQHSSRPAPSQVVCSAMGASGGVPLPAPFRRITWLADISPLLCSVPSSCGACVTGMSCAGYVFKQ